MVPGLDRRVGAGVERGTSLGLRRLARGRAATVQGHSEAFLRAAGPLHVLLRLACAGGMFVVFCFFLPEKAFNGQHGVSYVCCRRF